MDTWYFHDKTLQARPLGISYPNQVSSPGGSCLFLVFCMPSRSPAFQFYPDKWISHTEHLSPEAYQAYHRLLCWMWQHSPDQCSIPDDIGAISIACRISYERVEQAMKEIMNHNMPLLKKNQKRLMSFGLKKEAEKQRDFREKRKMAANTRWNKEKGQMQVHKKNDASGCTKDMHLQCSSSPSPTPSIDLGLKPIESSIENSQDTSKSTSKTTQHTFVLGAEKNNFSDSEPVVPDVLKNLKLYAADKKLCKKWSQLVDAWAIAFPGINILEETQRAHAWEIANPAKIKKNRSRFLNLWFTRVQDGLGMKGATYDDKPKRESFHASELRDPTTGKFKFIPLGRETKKIDEPQTG